MLLQQRVDESTLTAGKAPLIKKALKIERTLRTLVLSGKEAAAHSQDHLIGTLIAYFVGMS